jgi:hypothetical protein
MTNQTEVDVDTAHSECCPCSILDREQVLLVGHFSSLSFPVLNIFRKVVNSMGKRIPAHWHERCHYNLCFKLPHQNKKG